MFPVPILGPISVRLMGTTSLFSREKSALLHEICHFNPLNSNPTKWSNTLKELWVSWLFYEVDA